MFLIQIIEKNKSKKLTQWDADRYIRITVPEGSEVSHVDFAHEHDLKAIRREVSLSDGIMIAKIPNSILQKYGIIRVWLVRDDVTIFGDILVIAQKTRDEGYVLPDDEDEVYNYTSLEKRISELEKGGGTGGISNETDPTVPEWAKQPTKPTYTAEEVGASSVEEVRKLSEDIEELKKGGTGGGTDLDVQINGTSIVSDGVANIPIAKGGVVGVVKNYYNEYSSGIVFDSDGAIRLINNEDSISRRAHSFAIPNTKLDYAVKCAMTDGKGAEWTAEEKASARERIGASDYGVSWRTIREFTIEDESFVASDTESGITWTVDDSGNITAFEFDTDADGQTFSVNRLRWCIYPSEPLDNKTYIFGGKKGYLNVYCNDKDGSLYNATSLNGGHRIEAEIYVDMSGILKQISNFGDSRNTYGNEKVVMNFFHKPGNGFATPPIQKIKIACDSGIWFVSGAKVLVQVCEEVG